MSDEFAAYLLPNAVAIRFTESADLLNLHHKCAMRLCYIAQEEIWRASLDEALQIREVIPRIGPGSCLRARSATSPRSARCVPKANVSAASRVEFRARRLRPPDLTPDCPNFNII